MNPADIEAAAATEFDDWAASGRGERMEDGHWPVVRPVLEDLEFGPESRALDVGCGAGWLVRRLLEAGAAEAHGVDIAPAMIARAKEGPGQFQVASGAQLPYPDGHFSHLLSVESLYYYPDPAQALREWLRVTAPGGELAVIIELYADSPVGRSWSDALKVQVHNWSMARWMQALQDAGWSQVRAHQIPRPEAPKPPEAFEPSAYYPDYETLLGYHRAGALVLRAQRSENS